ncbi:MAG: Nif3-like dinuclear metal center hexameric protein [Candidatus Aenigmarchaeota archaeon]|nr:Nif3-like dinuclear metal center hexameric protein [Candidatus Aenigmarchaeota archaeon]
MYLADILAFLDKYLAVKKTLDSSRNGLQVKSRTKHVGLAVFAVDACMDVFLEAKKLGAELIVVHHGLLWENTKPDVFVKERMRFLRKNNISLYAVHLPLDMHKEVGNNAVIADILGVKNRKPFGRYDGVACGVRGQLPRKMARSAFMNLVNERIGSIASAQFFGSKSVRNVGIVSGSGSFAIEQMKRVGLDTLLSGEPKHAAYHNALEARVNAIYAGHYATERFGVQALSERLKKEFPEVRTRFLESPTGL